MKGIEPIRLAASDPKSDSATYYDTSGELVAKIGFEPTNISNRRFLQLIIPSTPFVYEAY